MRCEQESKNLLDIYKDIGIVYLITRPCPFRPTDFHLYSFMMYTCRPDAYRSLLTRLILNSFLLGGLHLTDTAAHSLRE